MKKRIGSKLYDTEKGIPVMPEIGLYKQPSKRTFYLFDGEKITPVEFDQAKEWIMGAGRADLLSMFDVKTDNRGSVRMAISAEHYEKLSKLSRISGISCKKLIENYIDSLSIE